jgi:peptide/nickel transport system substrate-binding protein
MFTTSEVGTPANRWGGGNRGGWSDPEVDRLWDQFNTTLDRRERNQHVIQMMKVVSDQLPAFPLFFNIGVTAHLSILQGPQLSSPDGTANWNIYEWQLS